MFNQFNVENKWKTYTDKIVSVSGELFVENDVDISGELNVNNIFVRNKPSYISWVLNTDITLDQTGADDENNYTIKNLDIVDLSGQPQFNDISYNTTTGDFKILIPGVYIFSFSATIVPSDTEGERYVLLSVYINDQILIKTSGSVIFVEGTASYNRNYISLNNIAYLNTGDILHFKISSSLDDKNATLKANETNGYLVKIT